MWKSGTHGERLLEWSSTKSGTEKDRTNPRVKLRGLTEGAGGASKEDGGETPCDVHKGMEGFSEQVSELKCSRRLAQNCYSELLVEEVVDTDNAMPVVSTLIQLSLSSPLETQSKEQPQKHFVRTMRCQKKHQTSLSITLMTLDMGKSSDHTALLHTVQYNIRQSTVQRT